MLTAVEKKGWDAIIKHKLLLINIYSPYKISICYLTHYKLYSLYSLYSLYFTAYSC